MKSALSLFIYSTVLAEISHCSSHWTVTDDGLTIQSVVGLLSLLLIFSLVIVMLLHLFGYLIGKSALIIYFYGSFKLVFSTLC